MKIGGWHPFSTIDYPGKLSCVVFTAGCALSCSYCHNKHLQGGDAIAEWSTVLEWIKERRGKLDAVVFSGGEPLLQSDLGECIAQVKSLGFLAGLHTAAVDCGALTALLMNADWRPDWIGLDLKGFTEEYIDNGAASWAFNEVCDSIATIKCFDGVALEIRTTRWEGASGRDLMDIAGLAEQLGIETYALQIPRGGLPASAEELETLSGMFPTFRYRA